MSTVSNTQNTQKLDYSTLKPIVGEISGYRTFSEAEATLFNDMKTKIRKVYEKYGYSPVENRPVERLENLGVKGGLNKEIYTLSRLEDGRQIDVGLPFDRTVPFALWIAQNMNEIAFPIKRFDIDYSFRGEHANMSTGRYRGFVQSDIDVIDYNMKDNIQADAETIVTSLEALKSLNIPPFTMHINHIKIAEAIMLSAGIPKEKIQDALHQLDRIEKIGKGEVALELQKLCPNIPGDKLTLLVEKFDFQGNIDDFKLEEEWGEDAKKAVQELKNLFSMMEKLGAKKEEMIYDARMVRGLDYYTGVVLETFFNDKSLRRCGSIASGGRYDNLVDTFVKKETSLQGVGVSIGLTRLFDILIKEKLIKAPEKRGNAHIQVCFRTKDELGKAIELSKKLRDLGYNVDLYSGKKKIGGQLSYADKKQTPFCLMVMNSKNSFVVKNLSTSGENNNNEDNQKDFKTEDDAIKHLDEMLKSMKK